MAVHSWRHSCLTVSLRRGAGLSRLCVGCVPLRPHTTGGPAGSMLTSGLRTGAEDGNEVSQYILCEDNRQLLTPLNSTSTLVKSQTPMRVTSKTSSCFISDAYEGHLRLKQDGVVIKPSNVIQPGRQLV